MSTAIQDSLNQVTALPFPEWAEDDTLADWQSELVETEGFVVGLAASVVGGGSPDTSMVARCMRDLRHSFDAVVSVPEEDQEIHMRCTEYLVALEGLARLLNRN